MIDDNTLIALFMGFTQEKNIGWYDNEMLMPQIVYDETGGNCFDELLFDKSWDWLMPVKEKIEMMDSIFDFSIGTNFVSIEGEFELQFNIMEDEEPINLTYRAVVEFIKWYNQQK